MTESGLWVPSPASIRAGIVLVPDSPLIAAADEAWDTLDALIDNAAGRRHHLWGMNLGAVAVYGLLAELDLRDRGLIDRQASQMRVERLARRQYDIRDARAGQASGGHWLKPTWWGSSIHEQHEQMLEHAHGPLAPYRPLA